MQKDRQGSGCHTLIHHLGMILVKIKEIEDY